MAKTTKKTKTKKQENKTKVIGKPVSKKSKEPGRITKDHNLGELVFKYPQTAEVLLDYGLHCVGCGAMFYDTIEAGAKLHGFTDEEIDELIERINEVVEFNE